MVTGAIAEGALISAVNLAEVASKLVDWGMDGVTIRTTLDTLQFESSGSMLMLRTRPASCSRPRATSCCHSATVRAWRSPSS
jgi:hypothetical protein